MKLHSETEILKLVQFWLNPLAIASPIEMNEGGSSALSPVAMRASEAPQVTEAGYESGNENCCVSLWSRWSVFEVRLFMSFLISSWVYCHSFCVRKMYLSILHFWCTLKINNFYFLSLWFVAMFSWTLLRQFLRTFSQIGSWVCSDLEMVLFAVGSTPNSPAKKRVQICLQVSVDTPRPGNQCTELTWTSCFLRLHDHDRLSLLNMWHDLLDTAMIWTVHAARRSCRVERQ